MAAPLVTLDTGSVSAARMCAVFTAAFFAESAILTDICTFRACREAIGANISAIFANIAIVAHKHAVFTIFVTLIAELGAFLAASAVKAYISAVCTSAAVVADDSTFFTAVTVRADIHTSTADAAVFAPAVALDTVIAFIAIRAEINTVVADTAAITADKRALIAGVAVCTNIDAVAADIAAVAPTALGCAGIAASANEANILTIAAGIAAIAADIGTFRAAVAIEANVSTSAAGVAVHAPAKISGTIKARAARSAERRAIGASVSAGLAQLGTFITAVAIATDIGTFAAGIAVIAPAVGKCAIIAPSAIIADDRANIASFAALDADIGASFAAVAVKANYSAVAADVAILAPTVLLKAIIAFAAIRTHRSAVAAHFFAFGTEGRAFLAAVLVVAQHGTSAAGITVFTPAAASVAFIAILAVGTYF